MINDNERTFEGTRKRPKMEREREGTKSRVSSSSEEGKERRAVDLKRVIDIKTIIETPKNDKKN